MISARSVSFGIMATALGLSVGARAAEVIDLGRLQIEGKMRGPEVQLVDPNRIAEQTAGKMARSELKILEEKLLQPQKMPKENP